MTTIESVALWERIERLGVESTQRIVAVAYVSDDAHLRFQHGDVLVCDASDKQIACGATSAQVLAEALAKGVKLYSLADLHAKMFVFDRHVVIGSMNVSTNSLALHEAGVISDSDELRAQAIEEIERLRANAVPINRKFIERVLAIKVVRTGGRTARVKKPTLLEAFDERHERLADFSYLLIESGSDITLEEVQNAAKSADLVLPAEDRLFWTEGLTEANGGYGEVYKKADRPFLVLGVEGTDSVVERLTSLFSFQAIYIADLTIADRTVHLFLTLQNAPFEMLKGVDEFAARFNTGLENQPVLAKKLAHKAGGLSSASEIQRILDCGKDVKI